MAIKPQRMDYWQLTSQIQKTLAETAGRSPQSVTTVKPITIKHTDVKTGEVTTETIPAGTSIKEIRQKAQERLAAIKPSQKELQPAEGVTIPITQAELKKIAEAKAKGLCEGAMKAYYSVKTYTVTLKSGDKISVQALSNKAAKQKALKAGYKVAWVTWSPKTSKERRTVTKAVGLTISIKDGKTGETLEFPKEGWEAWPDKYKSLVKSKGFDAAMSEFKLDYYELGDGSFMLKPEFYALPTRYADIAATKGFAAMQKAFESEHTKLGDGQWITLKDWDQLVANDKAQGTNFADIGKSKGYDAMVAAIDKANEPYREFIKKVEKGDIIPIGAGEYITKEEYEKQPTGAQQILKEQGIEALAKATTLTYEKIPKPKGVSWDPGYKARLEKWESLPDTVTQGEMNKIPFFDKEFYQLSKESQGRAGLMILTSIMPPAKATLPEYTTADITAYDWGIAAAQVPLIVLGFAPGAVTASVAGKAVTIGASTALSGLIGYGTAKNWANLTPQQRAMGVGMATLCAVPLITTVARNVKISGTGIPTTKGNITTWKGLSVAGHPIIGRSGGKWVLGTRSITLPEARMILNGYKPEMMLETKVFVNRSALEKAGFTKTQIDYLAKTLKDRNLFAGKSSPWLDKNVLIEPTQRLSANEISIIQQRLAKLGKGNLKDAHLLYGSPTIKAQLAPELRGWRAIHDWDISLNMNQAQTEAWTKALLRDLKAKGGATYRINPEIPTLIEKRIGSTWEHIADIHSQQAAIASAADIPASKLDATGEYSYGRMVSEPAITVKYPGVGELRIMRLSESGVRKADTILRVRQGKGGTAFKPPERGIAQPGVPKDAADFYVTLRNYELAGALPSGIAEEWLESWAKAMGYSKTQLPQVLPKIRKAMLDVAANTPSSIIGYEFKPASSPKVSSGASPSIILHVPSSLGASVSASLRKQISKPIYPYKLSQSPQMRAAVSAALSTMVSKAPSKALVSGKISPSVARSLAASKVSSKSSPSPAISKVPSPSPKPSPSTMPSIYPSGHPSPSTKPSKAPSSILSPKPSPTPSPSPVPSPKPSPYPYLSPKPGPKPKPFPLMSVPKSKKKMIRQVPPLASLKQGAFYISWYPPFRGKKPDVIYSRERPHFAATAKGRGSPQKTLRVFGEVPPLMELPMGAVIARVRHGRHLSFSPSSGRRRGKLIKR